MAQYTVNVVNPRRKKKATKRRGKKKATKRRSTKKKATKQRGKKKATKRKAKKKATKRRSKASRSKAAKKAAKTRAKKKAARSKAAKKAAKTRKKGKKKATKRRTKKKATKKPAKTRATRRKAKKNPGETWTLLSSKKVAAHYGVKYKKNGWILRKGNRVIAGPLTKTQMERYKSTPSTLSVGTRLKHARALAAGKVPKTRKRGKVTKRKALPPASKEGKALVRVAAEIEETKQELAGEARAMHEAVIRLTKARRKDKSHIDELEKQVKAAERRARAARKRGDLTKTEEQRLKDRLASCRSSLKRARAELAAEKAKPAKRRAAPARRKKATKKVSKRKAGKRAPARRRAAPPPWPRNVPRPGFAGVPEVLTVEKAIERLSSAAKGMRRGATASARRMQLASKGYLQLNPLADIPGHPGLVAQFKSPQSRRARAVAAKTPRSVRPTGPKRNKQMSARERQAILRKALRGT